MTSKKAELKIDWATHEAAKHACQTWHYSGTVPAGKTLKIGIWENGQFIGVIIYSYGANNNAPKSFGLKQTEICELTRVAMTSHITPVTRCLALSRKFLVRQCPGIKLVFSYADKTNQGHLGVIYQADNWLYLGERSTGDKGAYYVINGKKIHGRSARAKYGHVSKFPEGWEHVPSQTKHLYVKIIDPCYILKHEMKSYPKAPEAEESMHPDSIRD